MRGRGSLDWRHAAQEIYFNFFFQLQFQMNVAFLTDFDYKTYIW